MTSAHGKPARVAHGARQPPGSQEHQAAPGNEPPGAPFLKLLQSTSIPDVPGTKLHETLVRNRVPTQGFTRVTLRTDLGTCHFRYCLSLQAFSGKKHKEKVYDGHTACDFVYHLQ